MLGPKDRSVESRRVLPKAWLAELVRLVRRVIGGSLVLGWIHGGAGSRETRRSGS
jgi:hypothetical protein